MTTIRAHPPVENPELGTCEMPSERRDGTLCGFTAESIVDIVRYEGDGESTFFTLPLCLGHRLALGEHVITYRCEP
jgi:hypothetical protein